MTPQVLHENFVADCQSTNNQRDIPSSGESSSDEDVKAAALFREDSEMRLERLSGNWETSLEGNLFATPHCKCAPDAPLQDNCPFVSIQLPSDLLHSDTCDRLELGDSHNNVLHSTKQDQPIPSTDFQDIFPELWLRIFLFCPQKTIVAVSGLNSFFRQLIAQHEHILAAKAINSELVIILKVKNRLIVEKMKFLEEGPPLEYLVNGKRFSIYFRVTHTLLLHMDYCIKFRSTYSAGSLQREKEQIDREFMPIMRFPHEMHTYLKKRFLMRREFRPHKIKLNSIDRDMHTLWQYFIRVKCREHVDHVETTRRKLQFRPLDMQVKGLRWYLSHSGYESRSVSDKIGLALQLRDVLLSHQHCTIKNRDDIQVVETVNGRLEMRYTERSKGKGLFSLLTKAKKKTIVIPISDKYWNPHNGQFWFDAMYRCIVSRFVRP